MDHFNKCRKETVALLSAKAANYALDVEGSKLLEIDGGDDVSPTNTDMNAVSLCSYYNDLYKCEEDIINESIDTDNKNISLIKQYLNRLNLLKERYEICEKAMNELKINYEEVTERTSSIHNTCDRMMSQQTQIAAGVEQIRSNLYYYTECNNVMKKLSGGKISVRGQSFTQILATIEDCSTFLRQHIHYKDSQTFLVKYEQCLSKAMTVIKSEVVSDLQASFAAVRQRQEQLDSDNHGNAYADDDTFALLYGVFAAHASSVQSTISIAKNRFAYCPEFQSMLMDCLQDYFNIRRQLIEPIVRRTIEQMLSRYSNSSCALARNCCTFLARFCDDEFRLFKQFFIVTDDDHTQSSNLSNPKSTVIFAPFATSVHSFDDFIESICRILYDVLRPVIIHIPHLETLSEICSILKVEMIQERCGLMMSIDRKIRGDPTVDIVNAESSMNSRNGFVRIMNELCGDVAERMVYKVALYIQSDIVEFRPSPGDLAYPEKLILMKKIENEREIAEVAQLSVSNAAKGISVVDLHCLWYPTVSRTVLCLSKLFKCLEAAVFQSVARDLLAACSESLVYASAQVSASKSEYSQARCNLDADLFLVKHLLILREQTSPYRANASGHGVKCRIQEKDYSFDLRRYGKSASQLLSDRHRWFELSSNNAFLEFLLQVPLTVSESLGDSRRVIDFNLKRHCHELIKHTIIFAVGEISDFISQAEKAAEIHPDSSNPNLPLANSLRDAISQGGRKLKQSWPEIRELFSLYIGVKDTEEILLLSVKKSIADVFTHVNGFVEKHYDTEQQQIACPPSQENIWLIMNS